MEWTGEVSCDALISFRPSVCEHRVQSRKNAATPW